MVHDSRRALSRNPAPAVGSGSGPPSVLFLDNSSTFGGAIVSLKDLVHGLDQRGVKSVVVSGQSPDRLDEAFPRSPTVPIDVRVPHRDPTPLLDRMRRDPPRTPLLESLGSNLAAVEWHLRQTLPKSWEYFRIGRRHDIDVVHLNNVVEGQLDGVIAAKLLRVPCVAHARGFQTPDLGLRIVFRGVDHHLAISNAIARNLEEIGARADAISLVPDGINVECFCKQRNTVDVRGTLGIPRDAPAFGLFGRIMRWKGTREFVSAAGRVLRELPTAYALVVGDVSDGDRGYLETVRRLAVDTGVGDRILFTGYRDDVAPLMQALDLVVHSSIEPEPFGLVLAEAMAAATPVVAANSGGPLDIVEDGRTGILVDPRDTDVLASAIRDLLENPERARKMGLSGQKRAKELFNRERYADDVLEVYSQIVQ